MRAFNVLLLSSSAVCLLLVGPAQAAVVSFVPSPLETLIGQTFSLQVSIHHEPGEADSLFSYGIALLPEPGTPEFLVIGIDVPPALDFNGVAGPGAFKSILPDLMGVKGTIDLSISPLTSYSGSTLATFHLQFTEPGTYPFRLDFFNTLGPSEDIFISGTGTVLDNQITFGSATVQVSIPEPGTFPLILPILLYLNNRRSRAGI